MDQNGKQITLKDREYTIYEHDTLGIPYKLVDDNKNIYYLLLRDDRASEYYMVNGLFATKCKITKEELEQALNPPPTLYFGNNLVWNIGGGTGANNIFNTGGQIP